MATDLQQDSQALLIYSQRHFNSSFLALFFIMAFKSAAQAKSEAIVTYHMFKELMSLFKDKAVQIRYNVQHLALDRTRGSFKSWVKQYKAYVEGDDTTSLEYQLTVEPELAISILGMLRLLNEELDDRERSPSDYRFQ